MDILDTFGDWVQLFGYAALYIFILNPMIMGLAHRIREEVGLPMFISVFGVNFLLWISVYDYDIVIAYLIGGLASIVISFRDTVYREGTHYQDLHFGRVLLAIGTVIVMVLKMVLFW